MKQIEVVAAIIRKDDKIFATQRGYGEWKDWWEFPGGKMEEGETPEEALKREISEELSTEISVDVFRPIAQFAGWDSPQRLISTGVLTDSNVSGYNSTVGNAQ